jgi:hypothetical protein
MTGVRRGNALAAAAVSDACQRTRPPRCHWGVRPRRLVQAAPAAPRQGHQRKQADVRHEIATDIKIIDC